MGQVLDKLRSKGRIFISTFVQHMSVHLSWNILGMYGAYVGKWIFRFLTAACTA